MYKAVNANNSFVTSSCPNSWPFSSFLRFHWMLFIRSGGKSNLKIHVHETWLSLLVDSHTTNDESHFKFSFHNYSYSIVFKITSISRMTIFMHKIVFVFIKQDSEAQVLMRNNSNVTFNFDWLYTNNVSFEHFG